LVVAEKVGDGNGADIGAFRGGGGFGGESGGGHPGGRGKKQATTIRSAYKCHRFRKGKKRRGRAACGGDVQMRAKEGVSKEEKGAKRDGKKLTFDPRKGYTCWIVELGATEDEENVKALEDGNKERGRNKLRFSEKTGAGKQGTIE